MQYVKVVLQLLNGLVSWLNWRARAQDRDQSRRDGANESYVKASREVDKNILRAESAKESVNHTVDNIVSDPNNRAINNTPSD